MIRWDSQLKLHAYEVTVGHHRLRVEAPDPEEAIAEARVKLCDELPRLWDVIRHLDRQRFEVRPL